jgi:hypothetical protein
MNALSDNDATWTNSLASVNPRVDITIKLKPEGESRPSKP